MRTFTLLALFVVAMTGLALVPRITATAQVVVDPNRVSPYAPVPRQPAAVTSPAAGRPSAPVATRSNLTGARPTQARRATKARSKRTAARRSARNTRSRQVARPSRPVEPRRVRLTLEQQAARHFGYGKRSNGRAVEAYYMLQRLNSR